MKSLINFIVESREYRRYSMETSEYKNTNSPEHYKNLIRLRVFDCLYDKWWDASIEKKTGKVVSCTNGPTKIVDDFLNKLENVDFDWQKEFLKEYPMAYTITMNSPHDKTGWKVNKYPGYEIFMDVRSVGQLKKIK